MTGILTVSLVTLGDPGRLTGGYRYHRRMAELAPSCGAAVEFVSLPDRHGQGRLHFGDLLQAHPGPGQVGTG